VLKIILVYAGTTRIKREGNWLFNVFELQITLGKYKKQGWSSKNYEYIEKTIQKVKFLFWNVSESRQSAEKTLSQTGHCQIWKLIKQRYSGLIKNIKTLQRSQDRIRKIDQRAIHKIKLTCWRSPPYFGTEIYNDVTSVWLSDSLAGETDWVIY